MYRKKVLTATMQKSIFRYRWILKPGVRIKKRNNISEINIFLNTHFALLGFVNGSFCVFSMIIEFDIYLT